MKITNPSLELTFTYDNVTLTTRDIEQDSISLVEQLYNELSPSSNTASLKLVKNDLKVRNNKTLIGNIISEDSDIKAVLKSGNTVLFTGYLGSNYSWSIGMSGEDVLQVNLEGKGTRLLSKTYASEDDTCVRDTALNIINTIITKCGSSFSLVTPSEEVSTILGTTLTNIIDSKTTCETILKEICYELGLVYSFNTSGNLVITKTNLTATSSKTYWADNSSHTNDGSLYTYGKTAVSLERKAKQYKQVKVQYSKLKDSNTAVPVYQVTETIQVPAGQWWDGTTHSEDIYELTLDEFFQSGKTYYTHDQSGYHVAVVVVGDPVTPDTYYEYAGACATVEMTDLNNGKDIIYVYQNTVVPNNTAASAAYPGYVEATTGFGQSKWTLRPHNNTRKLDVLIDNTLSPVNSVFYSKFKADARIITKQSTNNIYRAATDLTANSEIQFDYESKWIHDQSSAIKLAELLNNYYLYCNNKYTFYSDEAITLGSVVTLEDNIHTGLSINVFVTGRTFEGYYAKDGVYKYTAQAVSAFALKQITRETSNQGSSVTPKDGKDGTGIQAIDYFYKTNTTQTAPDPATITSRTLPVMSSTDKYLYQKEVITFTDGTTKTTVSLIAIYGDSGSPGTPGVDAKVFAITANKATFERDLKYGGLDTIDITASIQGIAGVTSCNLTTTAGSLSTNTLTDGQTAVLTLSKYYTTIDSVTVTASNGAYSSEITFNVLTKNYEKQTYGTKSIPLYDAYYEFTDDTTVEAGKTYYTIVNGIGVPVESPSGNPSAQNWYELVHYYISGDSYVLQENKNDGGLISTIYVYDYNSSTGLYQWQQMAKDYPLFDSIVTDNISNVFVGANGANKLTIAQGDDLYDVYKYLIAQKISAVTYYIGENGCIYSGCYDKNGNKSSESSYGFYVSNRGQLKAFNCDVQDINVTNLTVNNINASGGEINVGKVSAGDCNIRGTLNMDDGTIDLPVITTYGDNIQSSFEATTSKDLYNVNALFGVLNANARPGWDSISINVEGEPYTEYAKQTVIGGTGFNLPVGTEASHNQTGRDTYWTGTAQQLIATNFPNLSVDWSQRQFITINIAGVRYHVEVNAPGGSSASDDYVYVDDGLDKFAVRGWFAATDTITLWNAKKTGRNYRVNLNYNYTGGPYSTGPMFTKYIECSQIWQKKFGNWDVTVPLGAKTMMLYYGEGYTNITQYRNGNHFKSFSIGSFSVTSQPGGDGATYYEERYSTELLGYKEIPVEAGDVIYFKGASAYGYSRESKLKNFQYAFFRDQNANILLRNTSTGKFLALSPDYNDSRNYFRGNTNLIVASKTTYNSLYTALKNNGLVDNVVYDLNEDSTITIDGTEIAIDKLQISQDQSGYIGYHYNLGWVFLNPFGYGFGGYCTTISADIVAVTGLPRIETKSVVPKDQTSTLGAPTDTNTYWSRAYVKNIRLERQSNDMPAIFTSTSAPSSAVGSVGDLWFTYSV